MLEVTKRQSKDTGTNQICQSKLFPRFNDKVFNCFVYKILRQDYKYFFSITQVFEPQLMRTSTNSEGPISLPTCEGPI